MKRLSMMQDWTFLTSHIALPGKLIVTNYVFLFSKENKVHIPNFDIVRLKVMKQNIFRCRMKLQ